MAEPTITKAATQAAPLRFFLGEDDFNGEVTVTLESFLLFDNEMTHGLDSLERRWSNWATPNSLRRDIWENVNR